MEKMEKEKQSKNLTASSSGPFSDLFFSDSLSILYHRQCVQKAYNTGNILLSLLSEFHVAEGRNGKKCSFENYQTK